MQRRSFLLLQGVCSPFFTQLAERLERGGHRVIKVNFTAGDSLYAWRKQYTHTFRDPIAKLPAFVASLWDNYAITDQVVFGDCRPVHRDLIELARRRGIRNHVFEEGYFRPFWVTLESEGVNGHSLLPRDPEWYRDIGPSLPQAPKPRRFDNPFRTRALHDIRYHLAGLSHPLTHPHYRTHSPVIAPVEYAGYALRFTRLRYWKHRDARRIQTLLEAQRPFFLLPLQLDGDAQIRYHSPFTGMQQVIERVMKSFAQYAPSTAQLVIKNHPLDMGLTNYSHQIRKLSHRFGLKDRVIYLESGNLENILRHASGTVTVNSTVGNVALGFGCPTLAMADPIYHMPGLTHQGSLDEFWQSPTPPDATLFQHFRRAIIHATQINGGFYCRGGIELAMENATRVLEADQSPLERLLCETHPQTLAAS